jgi:hypothetical protein
VFRDWLDLRYGQELRGLRVQQEYLAPQELRVFRVSQESWELKELRE